MRRSRRWDESSTVVKVLIMLLTAVQVSLAVSAWTDLAQRPAAHVNGTKRRWAAIIAINPMTPARSATVRRVSGAVDGTG